MMLGLASVWRFVPEGEVTVENGTIQNYYADVFYQYTTGSKILHVKAIIPVEYGIVFRYSRNGTVDHSRASGGSPGIRLCKNTRVNMSNSRAVGNFGGGLTDYQSLATLDNVTASVNGGDGIYVDYPVAAYTSKGFVYYTVKDSTANGNGAAGVSIADNNPTV
jgi:nitrous oxidase accessory protein NosD